MTENKCGDCLGDVAVVNCMPNLPEDFEVVIVVFKRENGERKISMAQKSLYFKTTKELLETKSLVAHLYPHCAILG